jgi:hypothetical protein
MFAHEQNVALEFRCIDDAAAPFEYWWNRFELHLFELCPRGSDAFQGLIGLLGDEQSDVHPGTEYFGISHLR